MRRVRLLAWIAGGVVSAVVLLFAGLQTAIGQSALITAVASLASSPDSRIEITGLQGFFPTDLRVARVALIDRNGVWLRADDARVRWSFASLFNGRVRIDALSAERLEILRPPVGGSRAASSSGGGIALPIGLDLRSITIRDLHVGPELGGGVDSHWKLDSSALVAADGAKSSLKLTLERRDGPSGRASADLVFDLDPLTVDGRIVVRETGKDGVIAAVLGRPDVERVAAKLTAKGDREGGLAEFTASAEDTLISTSAVRWHRAGGSTAISLKLSVAGPGLPDSPLARLLRERASLESEATLSDAGVLEVKNASLVTGPAELKGSATYDARTAKLDAAAVLQTGDAGPFGELAGGLDWRKLHLEAKVALAGLNARAHGTAVLSGSADDFALAFLGARAPPGTHVDLSAKVDLASDRRWLVDSLAVSSALASLTGSGSYLPSEERGEARFSVDALDLSSFAALSGTKLQGRARVDLKLSARREGVRIDWQGGADDLALAGLPPAGQGNLRLSGSGMLRQDGTWQLASARLEDERATLELNGHGGARAGEIYLALSLPHLELVRPKISGAATVRASVAYDDDEVHGKLSAVGDVESQPLELSGDFTGKADGSLVVSALRGRWASATVDAQDLTVTPQGTTGAGRLAMTHLEDLRPLLGVDLAGSVDLEIATEPDAAGKVRLALRGRRLRGFGVGVADVEADGTLIDPLGTAGMNATVKAIGLSGMGEISRATATLNGDRGAFALDLDVAGPSMTASLAAKVARAAETTRVELRRFSGRYRDIAFALSGPATAKFSGSRVDVAPASLTIGGGRVAVEGAIDSGNSDLTVRVAQLPLSLIESFAPGARVEGTLQATIHAMGDRSEPRVQATYSANGLRLKRAGTALMPALALQGSASTMRRQAVFDVTVTAGRGTRLILKGEAVLPRANESLRAKVAMRGDMDLAPFAGVLGNDLRNIAGTVRPDLTLTVDGESIAGTGTASIVGAALYLPETGLRLNNGRGNLVLEGDTLRLQRLVFQTARKGEVEANGTVRLAKGLPVDAALTTRNAMLINRPDLIASVSSDIKIAGSGETGIEVRGPITIDRAEIAVGVSQAAKYPQLQVREVNATAPVDPSVGPRHAPAPAKSEGSSDVRLSLSVNAPEAVYVRGRGLDIEVGGRFTVTGDTSHPVVLGGLALRRGTFDLVGHRFHFTRGNVSLVDAATVEPELDFAATTTVESATIEVDISGTPRSPSIALASSPLPQDEAMAMLLFGKASSSLSPSELLIAAQAVAELSSGRPVESGVLGRLRSSLGLDQLSVDTSSATAGPLATSVQGGRYVAPGVYVGAEKGATGNATRGVVEIEVLKHTKIEGAVGADSNGRIGAKMEWDY